MKKWLLGGIGLLIVALVAIRYLIPLPQELETETSIVDRNGVVIRDAPHDVYESIDEVPTVFLDRIVLIEDTRFRHHFGIDLIALLRALRVNIQQEGLLQGGSTIDQQVIKLSDNAFQRTRFQKVKEMLGALKLNMSYSKDEILVMYVNRLPFSYQTRGLEGGCFLYFGKRCETLTLSEQLFLIASRQLGANGFTEEGFERIKKRSYVLCEAIREETDLGRENCLMLDTSSPMGVESLSKGSPQEALHWLERYRDHEYAYTDQTSKFDLSVRRRIEKVISTSSLQRTQLEAQDCCVVVLDEQGGVVSMNVCRSWDNEISGTVNACLAKRQTGSAIKPFLYIYALEKLGMHMNDTIVDEPVEYRLENGGVYEPKNFDLQTHGEVKLAEALGSSLNIPAVKLLDQAGSEGFVPFLSQIRNAVGESDSVLREDAQNYTVDQQGLSLALGTYELSPLEFSQMWRLFLMSFSSLTNWKKQIDEVGQVLSENHRRILSFGANSPMNLPGWSVKTGTSRHFVDGRTCGTNQQVKRVVCVRVGNHDARPMKGSGSETAGYLWRLVAEVVS